MTIFVTGSAVFIGENLILDELGACDETAASVEKLTDAGNLQNLTGLEGDALTSSQLIAAQANRKRLKLTCPEEITFRQQWISAEQLYALTTSADQKMALANTRNAASRDRLPMNATFLAIPDAALIEPKLSSDTQLSAEDLVGLPSGEAEVFA